MPSKIFAINAMFTRSIKNFIRRAVFVSLSVKNFQRARENFQRTTENQKKNARRTKILRYVQTRRNAEVSTYRRTERSKMRCPTF